MEESKLDTLSPSDSTGVGAPPDVGVRSLEADNRSITSVNQAFSVCETMREDWREGINHAARITAKLNGKRPYNQKKLKDAQKGYKTNISTGFLSTECRKIQPRLHMPIKTAKYLTAASLPSNWPNGAEKTDYFRQTITEAVRSWAKYNFYLRGLAREVGVFGFGFNVWLDEWDWRPSLVRMDKGFIPFGTEIGEPEIPFFMVQWDYQPGELLALLREGVDTGRKEWRRENVVAAINNAVPPPMETTFPAARDYEDLVRQSAWTWRYTKGARLIRTWHLFAKEVSGKVSHYILLSGDYSVRTTGNQTIKATAISGDNRLLYENLDQFDSMAEVVAPTVFDFGDGTIQGSWGAGQILYDLAHEVEKIRCDSIDNMRNTNKMKLQVPEARNVNDVALTVNDTMMIVSGAEFAGNLAGMPQDIQGYELLDQKLTQIAQQKIGAFVPPIPVQPSDIKAAQINAAMSKEKELQEDVLECWLSQYASGPQRTMDRRLCKEGSPDPAAQQCQETLLKKLTRQEINLLCGQVPVQSIIDFTEFRSQQRAMFAASVKGDPLFRQAMVARTMAAGAGDERFVSEIVVPDGDQSEVIEAQRNQLLENAAIAIGQKVPVLAKDNDWVHMQTMKPDMEKTIDSGNIQLARLALNHYAAHYAQGVAKKQIPDEQINMEKSWIASLEKLINATEEKQQIEQQAKQAQEQATKQAQQMVQGGLQ